MSLASPSNEDVWSPYVKKGMRVTEISAFPACLASVEAKLLFLHRFSLIDFLQPFFLSQKPRDLANYSGSYVIMLLCSNGSLSFWFSSRRIMLL